jgi:D-proline reductase (dithiol) PrdB
VGLIQRAIEQAGIPTVSVSIVREYTEKVKPPRAVFLRWPFGHPFGEPGNKNQQSAVLAKALAVLQTAASPGTIVDPGWRWKRESYSPPPWLASPPRCEGWASVSGKTRKWENTTYNSDKGERT